MKILYMVQGSTIDLGWSFFIHFCSVFPIHQKTVENLKKWPLQSTQNYQVCIYPRKPSGRNRLQRLKEKIIPIVIKLIYSSFYSESKKIITFFYNIKYYYKYIRSKILETTRSKRLNLHYVRNNHAYLKIIVF